MYGFGIKETTTTATNGDLTIASVSNFPSFNTVFGTNQWFAYSILDGDGKPLEAGFGQLSTSTNLKRLLPRFTFDSGTYDDTSPAAVTLPAGTKTVINAHMPGMHLALPIQFDQNHASSGITGLLLNQQGGSTQAYSANALNAMLWWWPACYAVTSIHAEVTSPAAANNKMRLALYTPYSSSDTDGRPGNRYIEFTATTQMAIDSTGVQTINDFGTIFIPPGWYWMCWLPEANVTLGSSHSNRGQPVTSGASGVPLLYEADSSHGYSNGMPSTLFGNTWSSQVGGELAKIWLGN